MHYIHKNKGQCVPYQHLLVNIFSTFEHFVGVINIIKVFKSIALVLCSFGMIYLDI